jgi:hypothetical protein
MCRHNSLVISAACSHAEYRTTDPCGNAPEGFLSGAGALSCRKYEARQTVPVLDTLAYCSMCVDTWTADRVRRETVINFWEGKAKAKKEAKRAAKQQKK